MSCTDQDGLNHLNSLLARPNGWAESCWRGGTITKRAVTNNPICTNKRNADLNIVLESLFLLDHDAGGGGAGLLGGG